MGTQILFDFQSPHEAHGVGALNSGDDVVVDDGIMDPAIEDYTGGRVLALGDADAEFNGVVASWNCVIIEGEDSLRGVDDDGAASEPHSVTALACAPSLSPHALLIALHLYLYLVGRHWIL